MDLEEEGSRSGLEKEEEENKIEVLEKGVPSDENEVRINGEVGQKVQSKATLPSEMDGEGIEINGSPLGATESNGSVDGGEKMNESPLNSIGSPSGVVSEGLSPTPPAVKGYGLKKWRRIRRGLTKDGSSGAESSRILKRGLPNADPAKTHNENKQRSDVDGEAEGEGSAASVVLGNVGSVSHLVATVGALDPEVERLVLVGGFTVGADSESSEDRSSKFPTVPSAHKTKHEGVGFGRERTRGKNSSGKGSGHVMLQRGQHGKGGEVDSSKKLKEDRVRFEKENSISSVESDLRSSNAVLMKCGGVVSNGSHGDRSLNDEDNSDEAQMREEFQAGYYQENGREIGDKLTEDLCDNGSREEKREEIGSSCHHASQDPLAKSITLLQAAQEALEKEIQKFGEIGQEFLSTADNTSAQFHDEATKEETAIAGLLNEVECLEHKLQETSIAIEAKELKVLELEAILNGGHFQKLNSKSTGQHILRDKCKEMELELENLFRKKIEAEVEYLTLARTTQNWKIIAKDLIVLFDEQKTLSEDHEEMNAKLRDAENKAVMLKRQVERLEASSKELLETEEVLRLQNSVCKSSVCYFVQLVMLFVALGLFLMRLFSPSNETVPT